MPKNNRRPSRKLKPVLHIFCEGEKTEPTYIHGYIDRCCPGNRTLKIVKIEPTNKNTPMQLVDEAVKMKRQEPEFDEFWVVYDRESTAKYSGSLHAKARAKADANNIQIAISNVCFEVWILLHYENACGPFSCFGDLWNKSRLKAHLGDYKKGDPNLFSRLENCVNSARQRAKRMNEQTQNGANQQDNRPDQWNPYTNVYELLDAIDRFIAPIPPAR